MSGQREGRRRLDKVASGTNGINLVARLLVVVVGGGVLEAAAAEASGHVRLVDVVLLNGDGDREDLAEDEVNETGGEEAGEETELID